MTNTCCRLSSTYSSQWRKNSRVATRALTGFFSLSVMRCLLSASLSLKGLLEYSGQMLETKAMCLPSRDQTPLEAPVLIEVSWRGSPPAVSMIHSWLSPLRVDSNRTNLPFGLQRGCRSALGDCVSCFGSPLSVGASHRLVVLLLPSRSGVVTA